MYSNRSMWRESPVQPAPTRHLRGLGGDPLRVIMPDGSLKFFNGITEDLDAAFKAGGRPTSPNGGFAQLSQFQGGWLVDNCPLNVIFGQGWLPGQQEALKASGLTAACAQLPMQPAAPTTTSVTAPSPTFTPSQGAAFTSTSPGSYTMPRGPVAAQTQVISSSVPAPVLDPGMTGVYVPPESMPSWFPYAAIGLLAVILLRR